MNLLILTHQFAPNANPRAFRWTALAEHWASQGHQISVVCGVPGDEIPTIPHLDVHRVGIGIGGKLRRSFGTASQVGASDSRSSLKRKLKTGLASALRSIYRSTWKQLQWPDYASGWRRPAIQRATQLSVSSRFDAFITVSNPYTGHLVGLELKRQFPSLRWIADIGDPFSVDDRFRANNWLLYSRRNRRLEEAVLTGADAVTVVTGTMADEYRALFPFAAEKIRRVHPLLAVRPDELFVGNSVHSQGPRRLCYFGTLYPGLRSPRMLLSLFRRLIAEPQLSDLELHFYGNSDACSGEFAEYADLVGQRIFLHGPVAQEQAREAMRQSHVLVNIGNDLRYGLPSKVIEYAATGRPILNLAVIPEDTSAKFLERHPAAVSVFREDIEKNGGKWSEIVHLIARPPEVAMGRLQSLLEPHQVGQVAAEYEVAVFGQDASLRHAA